VGSYAPRFLVGVPDQIKNPYYGLVYCFNMMVIKTTSWPAMKEMVKEPSWDLISFHAENDAMCPLIPSFTPYIAIDTSIWRLNLTKTMILI
jgi:hypothetical protein